MPDKFTFSAGTALPELPESVAPELAFLARTESPLLIALGWPDNVPQIVNIKHEWLEDALLPNSSLLNGAVNTVEATWNVDSGAVFRIGDILRAEGNRELVEVTNIVTNALTVVRGYGGTAGQTVADNVPIRRMANPATEDETAPTARSTSRDRQENFTQIFRDVASVTRSMMLTGKLGGIDNELEHQILQVEMDLMRDLAFSVINSQVAAADPQGTTTQPRTMRGIVQAILNGSDPSSIAAAGKTLDEGLINDALEDAWTKGGQPTFIAAHPKQRRALSTLVEGRTRFDPNDGQAGVVVERFMSDFGELAILAPDIFVPKDVLLLLDPSRLELKKIGPGAEPFETFELARTKLSVSSEVVGEYTLEHKNAGNGGHAMISGLAF